MGKVSDINRTRVGNHPNTRRESTDYETSGINRSNVGDQPEQYSGRVGRPGVEPGTRGLKVRCSAS